VVIPHLPGQVKEQRLSRMINRKDLPQQVGPEVTAGERRDTVINCRLSRAFKAHDHPLLLQVVEKVFSSGCSKTQRGRGAFEPHIGWVFFNTL
jgi:hypothetical protein